MQLYFVKATYTNNVYKLDDFFTGEAYKLLATKMINIIFEPSDGLTAFTTAQNLPDGTNVRDYTHIIVPEYEKIYKITAIDYLNIDQVEIYCDDDPFIGQYLNFKDKLLFITRSNDPELFRGVNDISDLSFKETVETDVISPSIKSGKWALLFFQYNPDDPVLGLKFDNTVYGQHIYTASLSTLGTEYPEFTTDEPEKVEYYQQTAYVVDLGQVFQCVYYHDLNGGSLKWVKFNGATSEVLYFDVGTVLQPAKISKSDVFTVVIALPFETTIWSSATFDKNYASYQQFIGPVDTSLIDIKIVNDLFLKTESYLEEYAPVTYEFKKRLFFDGQSSLDAPTYSDEALTTLADKRILSFLSLEHDIDISKAYFTTDPEPRYAEPFYKYELYVFGKKFTVPYYLTNNIHLLIAMNSGVINYLIYYNDKRNILASGSFTHSIKYQIDQLDAFYSQNPTYKDQFFTKMAIDGIKTIGGGAIGGAMIGGPAGAAVGAGAGLASAGVDAGISMLNLHYQEKGLAMKPDQVYGENSEVSLQVINIFGVYWVKRTPENLDQMELEYSLKGFPTLKYRSIEDLDFSYSGLWLSSKVVYGELKLVIKNQYTTAFINEKLKQGIVLLD